MKPLPKWGGMPITAVNLAVYVALAAWGWGGWSPLVEHPARAGAVVAIVALSVAAMFTRGNITSGRREDTTDRWIFLPFLVLDFLRGWLPAYTDRRDLGAIDGDAVRYLGLALFAPPATGSRRSSRSARPHHPSRRAAHPRGSGARRP